MVKHNATSELHLIPLSEQRCFSTGQPEDPSAAAAAGGKEPYARYCDSSFKLNSMNHTTGASGQVEPLVRFLLAAL